MNTYQVELTPNQEAIFQVELEARNAVIARENAMGWLDHAAETVPEGRALTPFVPVPDLVLPALLQIVLSDYTKTMERHQRDVADMGRVGRRHHQPPAAAGILAHGPSHA